MLVWWWVKDEPYLIEYNVRMGDPECQTILPKLKTDLFEIIEACVNKNLDKIDIEWFEDKKIWKKFDPEMLNNYSQRFSIENFINKF